ncbi:MAG: hypothetical protein Q8N14_06525 [Candidatus Omnitrophota bacterium]|nr:hypothetical protein [Candidatus Omnitrophota bacterium]
MPKGVFLHKRGIRHSKEAKTKISKNNARFWLGKKRPETGIKISKKLKGRVLDDEHRENIARAHIGSIGYWRGKKRPEIGMMLKRINKGKKRSESFRRNLSLIHMREGSPNWKGGISKENHRIRDGIEFRLWREAVFARDNWTCQKYGTKGGKLNPHHIQNFAQYPELRFAIDNGITLSEKAHKEFHKKYGIKNNNREQLNEFLIDCDHEISSTKRQLL